MPGLLDIKNLSFAIGDTKILSGINFSLETGEVKGLVGASGSGKSMTALAIMRLTPESAILSGEILFDSNDLLTVSEKTMCHVRGRKISMIFQEPMTALNPLQTIGDQVAETLRLHFGASIDQAMAKAATLLDRVGLPPNKISPSRYPHQLSGGQRQRVMIAMAIAAEPDIIIADEPTTALDVTTQAEIIALMKQLAIEDDIGLLLITHNVSVISAVADNIVIMDKGVITKEVSVADYLNVAAPHRGHPSAYMSDDPTEPKNGSQSNSIILEAKSISCRYRSHRNGVLTNAPGIDAVRGVSLTLAKGENVGLVGESGCGKSTFARALVGLHPLSSGEITIHGQLFPSRDKSIMRKQRREIQIVFQDPYSSFDPRQNIGRIIAEPFHLYQRKFSNHEIKERVADVLDAVGLPKGASNKYPHQFSGGQRQRIAIARALITGPSLIILDEATSALDVDARNKVLDLLMRLSEERQLSYLFITHDLGVIRDITNRILVMKDGAIVEENNTNAIFNDPAHPHTQSLIEAAPEVTFSNG